MNEESEQTAFQNRRGSSNIDFTTVNSQLLKTLKNWDISDEESCSDHNILKFDIGQDTCHGTHYNYNGQLYVVTGEYLKKFDNKVTRIVAVKFRKRKENSAKPDRVLALQVKEANVTE